LGGLVAHLRGVGFAAVTPDQINSAQNVNELLSVLDHRGYGPQGQVIGQIWPTVVLVDETQALSRDSETRMLSLVEDRTTQIISKNVLTGQTMSQRVWIPHFTIIACTNRPHDLSRAFRDRLKIWVTVQPYSEPESAEIARRCLARLGVNHDDYAPTAIAQRAKGVPRRVIAICEAVRDQAVCAGSMHADAENCTRAFAALGLDARGLGRTEVQILQLLARAELPLGLKGLAAGLNEDPQAVEDDSEPYLLRLGFLVRSPRGRMITAAGVEHLRQHHGWKG
jgi:Holliday junction DNA helicase RuvB